MHKPLVYKVRRVQLSVRNIRDPVHKRQVMENRKKSKKKHYTCAHIRKRERERFLAKITLSYLRVEPVRSIFFGPGTRFIKFFWTRTRLIKIFGPGTGPGSDLLNIFGPGTGPGPD